jgi:acetyl esterase/lipase
MTWTPDGFLIFTVFCIAVSAVSCLSVRRPLPVFIVPIFIFGLLTSELTWFFFGLQLLVSAVFLAMGALAEAAGIMALALMLINWLAMWRLHKQAHAANEILADALKGALGESFKESIPGQRLPQLRTDIAAADWLRPLSMTRPGVVRLEDIAYGDAGERNLLDIYRPLEAREGGFPVLLQVHGGAWYMGHKQQQAMPLLNHLAQRGWLCVSINYRLSPAHTFPAHIIDVKKAIHWIKAHIAEYGGQPNFLAITGGSAGGHLTALAALSANDPVYQPGFETADTSVDVAVPLYGVYDFTDRDGEDLNRTIRDLLAEKIMPGSLQKDSDLWNQASPMARVHPQAPPFFVIHGANDVMTSPQLARSFCTELGKYSQAPVAYAELPGCQHAFDGMHSVRTEYLLNHITDFLEWTHARHWSTPA